MGSIYKASYPIEIYLPSTLQYKPYQLREDTRGIRFQKHFQTISISIYS